MDACQQYHATHIAGTCPWCGQELFPHSPESTVTIRQRIGYDDQGEVAWREEEVVRDEAEPGGGEPGNPEERPLVRLLVLVVRESIHTGVIRAHFTTRDGGAIEMHSPDGRMVRETIPARLIPSIKRWQNSLFSLAADILQKTGELRTAHVQDRLTVWNAAGEQLVVVELGD